MIPVAGTPIDTEAITLSDGTDICVRPITPEDAAGLVEFHQRLSEHTIYLRYFYPHFALTSDEVEHLTQVDYRDRLALVVDRGGQLVAVGRYERATGSTEAEIAFVVADDLQNRGLGTILLHRLAEVAKPLGVTHFCAEVLAENLRMLAVFRHSGFTNESMAECGVVQVRMAL